MQFGWLAICEQQEKLEKTRHSYSEMKEKHAQKVVEVNNLRGQLNVKQGYIDSLEKQLRKVKKAQRKALREIESLRQQLAPPADDQPAPSDMPDLVDAAGSIVVEA